MQEALLIIDVQNDYFPGGTCELYKAYEAEDKIKSLIKESRTLMRDIIYIQHINPSDETFFWRALMDVKFQNASNRCLTIR